MRIIGIFDRYFLMLMVIQCGIAVFVDSKSFKDLNLQQVSKRVKWLGISAIAVSIALFIIRKSLT